MLPALLFFSIATAALLRHLFDSQCDTAHLISGASESVLLPGSEKSDAEHMKVEA